ncbi:TatD DNase family protein [Neolewinella xylanilytica]|uniref:TatD DNase family protein n=1 Tax=Neolewinella xylanilytica TaxID=1514080 RepID=A0A2S6I332_9BACT|nr:TatD family hydrolase [Neolewinella xylanilytica]PPK85588.1 TatD DNase family protein [Neolewinella xylanilytica]
MFIDTHTHLYSPKFDHDRPEMIVRAKQAGIQRVLLPAIDRGSHEAMLALEAAYPDFCLAMIGLHPVSVQDDFEEELAAVERYLSARPWVAIGEIGMDLYWDASFQRQQEEAFLRQCEWAIAYDLPISIHARNAIDNLLEILEGIGNPKLRGVFHCFTGDVSQARRAVDLGFYLGIGGVATFKNGGIQEVIQWMPRDRVVLETDAPYLAPSPYRGKRNESAYLPLVARQIAAAWEAPPEEIARLTTTNARRLFDLDRFPMRDAG